MNDGALNGVSAPALSLSLMFSTEVKITKYELHEFGTNWTKLMRVCCDVFLNKGTASERLNHYPFFTANEGERGFC